MKTPSLTDRWRLRLFRNLETTDSGKPLKEAAWRESSGTGPST